MTRHERALRAETLSEAREMRFFDTPEALRARAGIVSGLDKPESPDDWLKVVWYSEACGGKLVRFKAGNPYLPKLGKRDSALTEEQKEQARLSASLSRTRRRIYEIAACNPWTWFFTGTLDGEKCDRNDLNGTFKRLSQFLRDFRKGQSGERIVYLIVPEQHKDGAWHFHGLVHGLSSDELYKFKLSDKVPKHIKDTIRGGTDVYTWKAYEKRFGWATFTAVRDYAAVSKYVTKYITKDIQERAQDSGAHMFYASQKLNKPEVLAEGRSITGLLPETDYENDWVAIRTLSEREEAEAIIRTYIGTRRYEQEL